MDVLSVFPTLSLDRAVTRWEEFLWTPTPVVASPGGAWYKREDAFAPLGMGGINGAKLRQLVSLVSDAVARGARGLITGASVLSPQLPSAAAVARHFDIPCLLVLGGTRPDTALRHEAVRIAVALGAQLRIIPVGYNPMLQRETARLAASAPYRDWYWLRYGITTPAAAPPAAIEAFHSFGAAQVPTIHDDVTTLHMTAGSCNSCVSVLYGIARHQPRALRRVVLYQIGPARQEWMERRFAAIEAVSGVPVRARLAASVDLEWRDLHGAGFARYGDRRPATLDGMVLHPTYEGKVLSARDGRGFGPGDLFWVVASEPHLSAMPLVASLPTTVAVPA